MQDASLKFTAIVLAGTRPGGDPFAVEMGVPYKALVRVGGRAMLARVLDALRGCDAVGAVVVVGMTAEAIALDDELAARYAAGEFSLQPGAVSPASSVLSALDSGACPPPLLVATGDHALLTDEMVAAVCRAARGEHADLVAGVVAESVVRRRYPDVRRTFTRFRDGGFKGTNLFALLTRSARRGPEAWLQVEHDRKRPWRMVRTLGPWVLLRFLLRRLTLAEAVAEIGDRMRLRLALTPLPFAEAALDVDSRAHLELAERILAARGG